MAARQLKSSEKQAVCKKVMAVLKKRYKVSPPKDDRDVLHTILFGICLENAPYEAAEQAYGRLLSEFHDLNEIRVSSISELEAIFADLPGAENRAYFIRSVLQYIFEKHFEFDFELLRRKTLDQAAKQLKRIRDLSHFVRTYSLQTILGSHVIPMDDVLCDASVWLGLVEPGSSTEDASSSVKSAVKKADVVVFCQLLRCFATDPELMSFFQAAAGAEGEDLGSAVDRLPELFEEAKQKKQAKKKTVKKKVKKPAPAAKKTTKKRVAPAKRSATKKTATKKKVPKTAAKKSTGRTVKKAAAKVKKTSGKRTTGKTSRKSS